MADYNPNDPTPPARIVKEQETFRLLSAIEPSSLLGPAFDDAKFHAMEKQVGKLKNFLFKFLTKLNLIEWLQWMNHACLNPLVDKTKRSFKSDKGIMPQPRFDMESQSGNSMTKERKPSRKGKARIPRPR